MAKPKYSFKKEPYFLTIRYCYFEYEKKENLPEYGDNFLETFYKNYKNSGGRHCDDTKTYSNKKEALKAYKEAVKKELKEHHYRAYFDAEKGKYVLVKIDLIKVIEEIDMWLGVKRTYLETLEYSQTRNGPR